MKSGLTFLPRDTRDHSSEAIADQRYQWMKGKTLQHILIDCFLKNYGYEKGIVTATAIVLVDKIIASLKEPLFIGPLRGSLLQGLTLSTNIKHPRCFITQSFLNSGRSYIFVKRITPRKQNPGGVLYS